MMPAGRAWRRFSVAEVPPTVMPEPGHARPAGPPPDRADARRAPAAPAPAAATRVGLVGAGRGAGALGVRGAGRPRAPCHSAVLAALLVHGRYHALRQRLREWLLDGTDK